MTKTTDMLVKGCTPHERQEAAEYMRKRLRQLKQHFTFLSQDADEDLCTHGEYWTDEIAEMQEALERIVGKA